jgi:hypothetical protein
MNLLTRLLCEAGNLLSDADKNNNNQIYNKMSKELKDWLWTHNKEDRKRQK